MKKIGRYMISFLLICMILLLSGELYRMHCLNMEDMYYINFEGIAKGEYEARFQKVKNILEQYDIHIVVVETLNHGSNQVQQNLYCDTQVKDELEKQRGVYEGVIQSFLGEQLSIHYYDTEAYTIREEIQDENRMYLLYDGDITALEGVPFQSFIPIKDEVKGVSTDVTVKVLWAAGILILLLMAWMDYCTRKKEWFVKMYYGYPEKRLILSEVAKEVCSYAFIFLVAYMLLHSYTELRFNTLFIVTVVLLFFVLDGLCNFLMIFLMDYKKALMKGIYSRTLLSFCYGFRMVTTFCCVLVLGQCMIQGLKLVPILKQATFYQQYQGYAHVQFVYGEIDQNEKRVMDNRFYLENSQTYCITEWDDLVWNFQNNRGDETSIIYANAQAESQVVSLLPERENTNQECVTIFLPEKFAPDHLTEEQMDSLRTLANTHCNLTDVQTEVYYGNIQTQVFIGSGADGNEDSRTVENPIIIYAPQKKYDQNMVEQSEIITLSNAAVKITKQETASYVQQNPIVTDYIYVDIWDAYQKRSASARRIFYAWLVVGGFVIIFDVMLMQNIIRIEHEMNALELSLKKIMGTPIFIRYKKMAQLTCIAFICGLFGSEILAVRLMGEWKIEIMCAGAILFFIEVVLSGWEIIKWEHTHLLKILKGGCI